MDPSQSLALAARLEIGSAEGLRRLERHAAKLTRLYVPWYALGDEAHLARRWSLNLAERDIVLELRKTGFELWPILSNWDDREQRWNAGHLVRAFGEAKANSWLLVQLEALLKADAAQGLLVDFRAIPLAQGILLAKGLQTLQSFCGARKLPMALRLDPPLWPALKGLVSEGLTLLVSSAEDNFPQGKSGASAALAKERLERLHLNSRAEREIELPSGAFAIQFRISHDLSWKAWEDAVKQFGPARRDPKTAMLHLKLSRARAQSADAISVLGILYEARKQGLNRACLLQLGQEDPRFWEMLEDFPQPFANPH
jgi:hypothetical protein